MPCEIAETLEHTTLSAAKNIIKAEKTAKSLSDKATLHAAQNTFNQAVADLVFHRQKCQECERNSHSMAAD